MLAASLARRRGVQASADEVVVTGGLGPALPFVWRLLAARGVKRVAIEDPCWPRLVATLTRAGLEPVPTPVDDARPAPPHALGDVGAVFVTPAHQYPTGAVLDPARRARADRVGARARRLRLRGRLRRGVPLRPPAGRLAPGARARRRHLRRVDLEDARARPAARLARAAQGHPRRHARAAAGPRPARARRPDHPRRLRPPPAAPSAPLPAAPRGAARPRSPPRLPGHAITGAAAGLHAVLHVDHRRARGARTGGGARRRARCDRRPR